MKGMNQTTNGCCKEKTEAILKKIEMFRVTDRVIDVRDIRPIKDEETYIRIMNETWENIKREFGVTE